MTLYGIGFNANGTAADFPTPEAFIASGTVTTGDIGEFRYSDGNKNPVFIRSGGLAVNKAITFRGLLPNRKTRILIDANTYSFTVTAAATFSNLTLISSANYTALRAISIESAISATVDRVSMRGFRIGLYVTTSGATVNAYCCEAVGGTYGFFANAGTTLNAFMCNSAYSVYGFNASTGSIKCVDCLSAYCGTCFSGSFSASSSNNGSTDATAPGSGSRASLKASDMLLVADSAAYLGVFDARILPGSSLVDDGADPGFTTDIDGQSLNGVYPIGASSGVLLPGNDSNYVLSTATPAGLYVPPSVDDVRPVSFGVGATGTLANLNGTESAYQTLEATRNTDPGVSNVVNGTSYKIQNVSKTGTLTSLGTTSTPTSLAIADDGDGCAWAITAGIGATEALYLYNNSDDSLVGVFDASCTTEDLTPGVACYCKALAANKALSARYPSSGGVTVPSIAPVSSIDPATCQVNDNRDGSTATATLTDSPSALATNEIYLARYSANVPLVWSLAGTRTGDGDVTLSPGAGQWVAQVRTTVGAATGIGLGSTFWITSADDKRRMRIRDRTASSTLRVARRLGFQIAYQSPGLQQINLWAVPESFSRGTNMMGGEVGTTAGRITVPRQADFPPYDGIIPGAKVWIDGIPYGAEISWNAESEEMSAVFQMSLTRLDISVELDDEDDIA